MLDNKSPSEREQIAELLGYIDGIRRVLDISVKAGIAVPYETAALTSNLCVSLLQSDRYAANRKSR